MSQRKPEFDQTTGARRALARSKAIPASPTEISSPAEERLAADAPASCLIYCPEPRRRRAITAVIEAEARVATAVTTASDFLEKLVNYDFDVVAVDLAADLDAGLNLILAARNAAPFTTPFALAKTADLDAAVQCMRAGAVDLLTGPVKTKVLRDTFQTALESARAVREQLRREARLKRLCKRLNSARKETSTQINVLCNDLVGAYRDLADQVSHVTLASEFSSLIQQELDVEALLRTSLEYMLTKTGPTNAAVFLPSSHCDFSLGAYVNYDCPRDAADVLLDHLADIIAPRFQDEEEVLSFESEEDLTDWIGNDANWLADSRVIVFSCRDEGECLAVVTFFRDRSIPFPDELPAQLRVMADLFAKQLSKIIRVHHRHKPDDAWNGWDSWEEDDESGGMAA